MSKTEGIGKSVEHASRIRPYMRKPLDPLFRPLQIYSTDPADSKLDGSIAKVNVPFEPLEPGPVGCLFEVIGTEESTLVSYPPLDLESPKVLVAGGIAPSPVDSRFLMQMTYAVAMSTYEAFRIALGRDLNWGFDTPEGQPARLKIYPFFAEQQNAYYDREAGAVKFGWYTSKGQVERKYLDGSIRSVSLREGKVFTALSHDIVAHEISHALLDGLRPNFLKPYHRDTLAFHEGFADLVAVFQHFSHRDLVAAAIRQSKGAIEQSDLLTDIARQFGQTQDSVSRTLRTAIDSVETNKDDSKNRDVSGGRQRNCYEADKPIHQLGSVLVSAVFEAFTTIFKRKTQKYINLATDGTGVLPEGNLPPDLSNILAKEASKLAQQFLSICIRAIDYCPPVAVTFGDYLRAMITADFDLVPSDPYGYREALIDAFILRNVPIEGVDTISESTLLWEQKFEEVNQELLSAILSEREIATMVQDPAKRFKNRARRVRDYLLGTREFEALGLVNPENLPEGVQSVGDLVIESARISRRVGPDNRLETDLVVEVTQEVTVLVDGYLFPLLQGATVIFDERGRFRYVINKNKLASFVTPVEESSDRPFDIAQFWQVEGGEWKERANLLFHIHQG